MNDDKKKKDKEIFHLVCKNIKKERKIEQQSRGLTCFYYTQVLI